jgi:predicted Zn-dependent protease
VGDRSMETETLARLYLEQGHPERAAAIFERLLRREPTRASLLEGLSKARAAMANDQAGDQANGRAKDPKEGRMSREKLQVLRRLLSRLTGEVLDQEEPALPPAAAPLKPPASAPGQRKVEFLRAMLQRLQARKQ